MSSFATALHEQGLPKGTAYLIQDLFSLFALSIIDADSRSFSVTGAVDPNSLDMVPQAVELLLAKIRPHAVKLVDGWAMPEYLLNSALGRYDGRVYEELFDMAHRHNPLNQITFNSNWKDHEIILGAKDEKSILAKL